MDEHFPITICINEKKCIRRVPRIAIYKTKKLIMSISTITNCKRKFIKDEHFAITINRKRNSL
jgi:hypothetical protein